MVHIGTYDGERKCTDCGSIDLFEDWKEGDLVCRDCGLVNEAHMIDFSAEWMNNPEEGIDRSRVGAPTSHLYETSMMSTAIPKSGKTWMISRLHDHMSMTYKDRALHKIYVHLQRVIEEKLALPACITDSAKDLYKHIKDTKITRGENHKALVACCVYYACKLQPGGYGREKAVIATAFEVDKSTFTAACKIFLDMVKDKPFYDKLFEERESQDRGMVLRMLQPFTFADSQARWKFARMVEDTYHEAKQKSDGSLDSKTPHSIVSAIIYIVSEKLGMNITKNDIKLHCQVSTVTLNKSVQLLNTVLGM